MAWTEADFTITCAESGTEHAIRVATPFRYDSLESVPLIVCLDGVWTAGTVRDATRIMSMSGEAPEALVVSVSFADATMSDYLRSRARWFCPTQWVPPEVTGVKGVDASDMGRALTYLALLRDQLLPRLVSDYRISQRWLVGHSFSALFGLRVLFSEPTLFDNYLLASPSIWWHDRVMLDIEAEYAATHDDLPARVFVSAGEQEGADAPAADDTFRMRRNVEELVATLASRGYPSLSMSHAILPTETHSSTIGAAISRGLRALA